MTEPTHFIDNTHGRPSFDPTVEPVLRITPGTGETIGFETDDAVYEQIHDRGSLEAVTAPINPVTGPVHVDGARPGDTLAVTIHAIDLIDHGWSVYLPGVGALAARMGEEAMARRIPLTGAEAVLTDDLTVPLRPMIGCIGTAPASGTGSTIMPSYGFGGNMDLTDAAPGSVVYLPVEVEGGLLSIGDLHAIMARGESSFVAIEAQGTAIVSVDLIPAESATAGQTNDGNMADGGNHLGEGNSVTGSGGRFGATTSARESMVGLRAPRIETAEEWIFVGLGDPVQESITRGYEDMFDFLTTGCGWARDDAYVVMSALAHSELGGPTGSVDPDPLHPMAAVGSVTVHRLPKSALS